MHLLHLKVCITVGFSQMPLVLVGHTTAPALQHTCYSVSGGVTAHMRVRVQASYKGGRCEHFPDCAEVILSTLSNML